MLIIERWVDLKTSSGSTETLGNVIMNDRGKHEIETSNPGLGPAEPLFVERVSVRRTGICEKDKSDSKPSAGLYKVVIWNAQGVPQ